MIINVCGEQHVREAVDQVRSVARGAVQLFVGDLSWADDCNRLLKDFPDIDILVNNLGIFDARDFFRNG